MDEPWTYAFQLEGACPHGVLFVVVDVLIEVLLGVNKIGGMSNHVQERRRQVAQVKDHRVSVRRFDALDHLVGTLAYADHALSGKTILSQLALTSADVSSLPSWNFTPWCSVKVYVRPSAETVHAVARSPMTLG